MAAVGPMARLVHWLRPVAAVPLLVAVMALLGRGRASAFEIGPPTRTRSCRPTDGARPSTLRRPMTVKDKIVSVSLSSDTALCRRHAFHQVLKGLTVGAALESTFAPPSYAIFGGQNRRQLEFCLVNVIRVKYWAESIAQSLKNIPSEERRKELYLEARLGSKAIVTGRIGGGATGRVYTLATLQFRGCLEDLVYYAPNKRKASDLAQDLIEALAAVVEFDGLENTTEGSSPRSSLTMSMYNDNKATYVQRLLSERVVPIANSLINCFDPEVRRQCEAYVASNYPNEVPRIEVPAGS